MIKIIIKKIIVFFIILLVLKLFIYNKNVEKFIIMPWNIGTRFFPMYDIRGYPNIYPPYPFVYFFPNNYSANGEYTVKSTYKKKLNKKK